MSLTRLMTAAGTDEDRKMVARHYVRNNREVWKALGFRSTSLLIHEDDREIVLAQIDVQRGLRLARLCENPDAQLSDLQLVAQRNMSSRPTKEQRSTLKELADNSAARKEIEDALEQCAHYLYKFTGVSNNYDPEMEYSARVRLEAKAVVYGNLCASYYRLAEAFVDNAEKLTVFNVAHVSKTSEA